MIAYEVDLEVDRAIATEYLHWLHDHMARLRALPGFQAAQLYQEADEDLRDDAGASAPLRLCARYLLRDAAAYQRYLREDAARMRAEGVARFGTGVTARRRVLRPLAPA